MRVEEHTTTIDDVPVYYRTADGIAPGSPVPLYLHEALTSSEDWMPFLERTGGLAPDLIGFGRSGKGGHLDYSPNGLTSFLERVLDALAIDRFSPVGHGWGGALALILAQRRAARIERIVLIDPVPLLGGFRWPRPVQIWRRPLIGELAMGATSRRQLTRALRRGVVRPQAWSDGRLRTVWEQFDQGTQRALLRLHRAADEDALVELGKPLPSVSAPTLILHGQRDRLIAPDFADAYGAVLPNATVERVEGAGHWPWLDEPRVIERVAEFLA